MPFLSDRLWTAVLLLAACGNLPACSERSASAPRTSTRATRPALIDPKTCKGCHPTHYDEWSGSMHAYASDDPVFLAMNRRGQRATKGALGTFCLQCHAPMAVVERAGQGAIDPAELPPELRGVTCFFCHTADSVDAKHPFNNSLHLADDLVMRAGIADPVDNPVHASSYSAIHDGSQARSASRFCGSCHDIVSPAGGHVERTYEEWAHSLFAKDPPEGSPLSCGGCHMTGRDGLAADGPVAAGLGPKLRKHYNHAFPGVDVALTDGFPNAAAQRAAVQDKLQNQLLQAALCVNRSVTGKWSTVDVHLDNIGAGHAWPSGATQDRRAWVELIAYKGDRVVYHSGTDDRGKPLDPGARIVDRGPTDPDLWLLRDCMFDASGKQVHMFWQAAASDPNPLPAALTLDPTDPDVNRAHIVRSYPLPSSTPSTIPGVPDRVTLRVLLQPIGLDVLDLLAAPDPEDPSAPPDLDPAVATRVPTFSVLRSSKGRATLDGLEWNRAAAAAQAVADPLISRSCVMAGNVNLNSDWYPPTAHAHADAHAHAHQDDDDDGGGVCRP